MSTDIIVHNPELEYLLYLMIFVEKGSYPKMKIWRKNVIIVSDRELNVVERTEDGEIRCEGIRFFDYVVYIVSSELFKVGNEEYRVENGEIKRTQQLRLIRRPLRSR